MADAYGKGAQVDENPRCWRCNRMLAVMLTRPWIVRCSRCKAQNNGGGADQMEPKSQP